MAAKKVTKKSSKSPAPLKKKASGGAEAKKTAAKKVVKAAKKVVKRAVERAATSEVKAVRALATQTAALLKPQPKTVYAFEYRLNDPEPPA